MDSGSVKVDGKEIFGLKPNALSDYRRDTAVVAVGALIAIPVSKLFMDAIYPYAISNIACGMNLHFPWYMYAAIYIGIMLIYFGVNGLLTAKLKKITPAEKYKNYPPFERVTKTTVHIKKI